MTALITEKLVTEYIRKPRNVEIRDSRCRGLVLRCRASGKHTYRFEVRRGRRLTIGRIDDFTPDEARKEAQGLRGDVARGKDPIAEKRRAHAASLDLFLEKEYEPWALAHRKTGDQTLERLRAVFKEFLPLPLSDLSRARIERWRTARLEDVEAATVNRDLAALRSVLSRAVEFGVLREHPFAKLKAVKVDQRGAVRYLSPDEEKRLRAALEARDEKRRTGRLQANGWRRARGYAELPTFGAYTDHVTPLVLLAVNTGLRRGELLGLEWRDVDLALAVLTVQGSGAKSGETRHVPLNTEAVAVLKAWRGPAEDRKGFVFDDGEGEALGGAKTSWGALVNRAKLDAFRFHDLRHTFASKLVMAGVDLNTVRELLGHADLKMTLRYAHLAPAVKAAAVEKLVSA